MSIKKLQNLPKGHEARLALARWYRSVRNKEGGHAELRRLLAQDQEGLSEMRHQILVRAARRELEQAVVESVLLSEQPVAEDRPTSSAPGSPKIYDEETLAEMKRLMSQGTTRKVRLFEAMKVWTKNKYGAEISVSSFDRRWRMVRPKQTRRMVRPKQTMGVRK
jgi:hypothetical protein